MPSKSLPAGVDPGQVAGPGKKWDFLPPTHVAKLLLGGLRYAPAPG